MFVHTPRRYLAIARCESLSDAGAQRTVRAGGSKGSEDAASGDRQKMGGARGEDVRVQARVRVRVRESGLGGKRNQKERWQSLFAEGFICRLCKATFQSSTLSQNAQVEQSKRDCRQGSWGGRVLVYHLAPTLHMVDEAKACSREGNLWREHVVAAARHRLWMSTKGTIMHGRVSRTR